MKAGENMWKAVADKFWNINLIFPTKQKDVSDLVKMCRQDKNIKRAIVFGSAVTPRCNVWSDIDVYFEFHKEPWKYPILGKATQAIDKFCNFSVSDEFRNEILSKGVVVYEQQ